MRLPSPSAVEKKLAGRCSLRSLRLVTQRMEAIRRHGHRDAGRRTAADQPPLADGTVTGFSDAQLLERFVAGHDAAAFEALVARHGPMVLSVCRGILNDPNDAEDAFQATFLILVKKSGTFRGHVALGPWLYQVAHRVAIRANAAAARRRACERRAGQMAATTSASGPSAPDEQLQALHEEIARLPEKLRRAIILCDLQSVPQDRAAGELRLSERTLQRRLSEGRAAAQGSTDSPGTGAGGRDAGGGVPPRGPRRRAAGLGRGDRPGGAGHRESLDNRRGRLGGGQGIDSGGAQNHAGSKSSHWRQPPSWLPA